MWHFFGIIHVPLVSSSLPHSGLTDMLLLLYLNNNRSNSPPRLMGIAHCSQSFLALTPTNAAKQATCPLQGGPAEFWSQELKNLLQLHPSRPATITPLGALWSGATVQHHPLPTARRRVWLAFVVIHITDFSGAWSLRAIHLFALRSCSAIPYWVFPIHHYWPFHLCPLLGTSSPCLWIRGDFFPIPQRSL